MARTLRQEKKKEERKMFVDIILWTMIDIDLIRWRGLCGRIRRSRRGRSRRARARQSQSQERRLPNIWRRLWVGLFWSWSIRLRQRQRPQEDQNLPHLSSIVSFKVRILGSQKRDLLAVFVFVFWRTIQLKHEGWGVFFTTASQDNFVGFNPLTILSGQGHISELIAQHSHFSDDWSS